MRIIDPRTGRPYLEKRRRRRNEPGEPRGLTFSCYRRYQFLTSAQTREWFRDALAKARVEFGVQVWAYVIMPEHVHLLVYPEANPQIIGAFLQAVKSPVGRQAIAYLRQHAPHWLPRLRVREGKRIRYRFWQPGGGYDRNVERTCTLRSMIEYFHANPVRRKLVERPEDWEWSSARWFAGLRSVPILMDEQVLQELALESVSGSEL